MKKIIIVLMLLALSVGMVGCGGGGSGSSANPGGEKKGVPSVVQLLSTHSIAQTNSTVYLHTKVLDGNGVPVRNEAVTYTNLSEPFGVIKSVLNFLGIQKPLGVLSATVVRTNNLGIATVKLTSTTAGFATIQAEVNTGAGQVRDKRTIFFTTSLIPATPPPPTIALHVDDGNGTYDQPEDFNLFKGGSSADNQRSIKAVVKNGFGQPVSGATVFFTSDSPNEVTFSSGSAMTNSDGIAVVIATINPSLLANFERIVNIAAQSTIGSTTVGSMVSLFIQPVNVSSITVNANPIVVAPNGTSTVLATVRMLGTLPVPDGTAVAFETTCGFITPFAQTTNGIASATFTAPSIVPSGPCTVTAIAGGVSGTVNINVSISMNVQPGSQTINGVAGGTATYTIFGGVAPFTVTSNDPEFPAVLTDNIFTVTVPPNSIPKTVTYTVRDNTSASPVTATLNIGGAGSLQVLPGTVTVDSASPEDTITFTIFGGVAPYFIFSNNPSSFPPSTPTVDTTGGTFTVTIPVDAPSGTVVMTVRDSNNPASTTTASITITVVAPQPLRVVPTVQTIGNPAVTNTAMFNILGGRAPYKAYSNNPVLVSVPEDVAGSTVLATVESVPSTDTTVTITIYDSLGTSVSGQLILDVPPILPMSVIPASQTLSDPIAGDLAQYQILGGSGGYTAFSNNPGIAAVSSLVGSVLTVAVQSVPSTDTTVTFTIYDSDGSSRTANLVLDVGPPVVLSLNPVSISLTGYTNPDTDAGDNATFYIQGGRPPYSMYSNNNAVISSQGLLPGNNFTIDPEAVSSSVSVTLTVEDSLGASVTSSVTVTPATSAMGVNPSSITVVHPTVVPFHILGGLPDYTIFPTNLNVADIGGNPLVITAPWFTADTSCLGSVNFQIVDKDGRTVTATLNVTGPALSVLPTSQTIINPIIGNSAVYSISGGIAPYFAYTSHPTLVSTTVVGSTLTANVIGVPDNDTTVTITVVDHCGNALNVTLLLDVPAPPVPPPPPATLAINPSVTNVAENVNAQVLLFQITGGTPNYTILSTNANLAFNDNGVGGGTANNGIRDGAEGGVWSVITDGGTFNVTISGGDIVAMNTDVSLLVNDSGAQNTSSTITIQEAIP